MSTFYSGPQITSSGNNSPSQTCLGPGERVLGLHTEARCAGEGPDHLQRNHTSLACQKAGSQGPAQSPAQEQWHGEGRILEVLLCYLRSSGTRDCCWRVGRAGETGRDGPSTKLPPEPWHAGTQPRASSCFYFCNFPKKKICHWESVLFVIVCGVTNYYSVLWG